MGFNSVFKGLKKSALKLTATGNESHDVLLLVKPLFLLLGVDGGWFQPRLLLNQSLISPSGAPVKPLPLHHNSPQSATLVAIYCHPATQTEHCAAENGGQSRASSFRLLEKFFAFFIFMYIYI